MRRQDGLSTPQWTLPPLETDGQIDLLTGLDSPEIFYRFLKKGISASERSQSHVVTLIRVRLELSSLQELGTEVNNSGMAFRILLLSKFLQSQTREDENLVRIGEATFLILAKVENSFDLDSISRRFKKALAEVKFDGDGVENSVDNLSTVDVDSAVGQSVSLEIAGYPVRVAVDGYLHQRGEEMLDFLERVGV